MALFKDRVSLEGSADNSPDFGEIGQVGSYLWQKLGGALYNPDNIGIATYKVMLDDANIQACLNLIKLATLSRDWRVIGSPELKDEIEFVKWNFDHIEGRLDGALSGVLDAIPFGFSVTEKVWNYITEGKYKGKIGLTKLKPLDPEFIEFVADKYGNIEKVIQKSMGENGQDIEISLNKSIIYTENKQFGNVYGKSRLRSVYKNWFIKDTITKFWNIYLERFGMPLVVGTVPNKTFMDKMKGILENIQSRSSIVKTSGWEIDFLESKKSGSSVSEYKIAIDYHNAEIMKGMLVPSLMIEVAKSGSYALGQTQFDIFTLMLKNLENDLTSMVEKYIIQPLVEYNFGQKQLYPEFKLEPLTKTDLLNLSKVFALLVKNGIVGSDETFMRDMMNIPHREDVLIEESSGSNVPKTGKVPAKPPLPAAGSQQVKSAQPQRDESVA